jgi:hypothetical protein
MNVRLVAAAHPDLAQMATLPVSLQRTILTILRSRTNF